MKSKVDYMKERKRKDISIASKALASATPILSPCVPFSEDLTIREEITLCGMVPNTWLTIAQLRPLTNLSSPTLTISLNRLKHRGLVVDRPPKNTSFKKEWKLKDDSDNQDTDEQDNGSGELSGEDSDVQGCGESA